MTKCIFYLSDNTQKMLQEIQEYYHLHADDTLTHCIDFVYASKIDGTIPIKPIEKKVNSLVMSILQQTLDEGKSISIPSLGIVISPTGDRKGND